jgi:hypothetical protein
VRSHRVARSGWNTRTGELYLDLRDNRRLTRSLDSASADRQGLWGMDVVDSLYSDDSEGIQRGWR